MKKSSRIKYFIIGLFLGVLSTSGVSLGYLNYSHRQSLLTQASIQIKIICNSIAGGFMCDDRVTMTQILDKLKSDDSVVFAGAYDNRGKLLASYRSREIPPQIANKELPVETGCRFVGGYLKVAEPVLLDGSQLGLICIYHKL